MRAEVQLQVPGCKYCPRQSNYICKARTNIFMLSEPKDHKVAIDEKVIYITGDCRHVGVEESRL